MSFTTIDAVAAHFPGFERGVTGQNPSDDQIQLWIDSQSARLTGLALARGYTLEGLEQANPQAYALLALMNELAAAADLGDALFSLIGPDASPQGWASPNSLRRSAENMVEELKRGTYDKLFLPTARTGDAFGQFGGAAGQEPDLDDTDDDTNVAFRKNANF
jgi:hypothetical protein